MLTKMLMQYAYRVSIFMFAVYFANILVGKISMWLFSRQLPMGFDGVIEFLILCAACIFFVIGILRSESLSQK